MGLFTKNDKSTFNWIVINSIEELNSAFNNANDKPALFFKHSTRCSISSMALNGFERNWNKELDCDLYYIDLLVNRDVSNRLAEISNVMHQSPQAIVVQNNEVVYNASHSGIDAEVIESIISAK